ncbi:uncharacterized protein K452DRAFT_284007 [Aplosporella prunicola CBS 121167]|uniref:Transcription initiation factor IIA subunit 2 n=1 Tax=Aplosporella prunicola CBS 121167 TaxID=1176127 RepID=A0A6A6BQX9_9PEZI|nr:uncharacterized protein K452DRAFT_284007 [Aplosporella prunicola CBS 121167]KAF2145644.1 hypothetical protein K452DRAFT_284007 [Aplosporella prunicola CBS 121167]
METDLAQHHYRGTSIGLSLIETLDDLIRDQRITPQLSYKVLAAFDKEIVRTLKRRIQKRMTFKAQCRTYGFYDDKWKFELKDVKYRLDSGKPMESARLSISAISSGADQGKQRKAKKKQKEPTD